MRLVHVTSNNNVPGATKSTFHGNRNYETERVLESLARNNVARVDKSPWSFSLSLSLHGDFLRRQPCWLVRLINRV